MVGFVVVCVVVVAERASVSVAEHIVVAVVVAGSDALCVVVVVSAAGNVQTVVFAVVECVQIVAVVLVGEFA